MRIICVSGVWSYGNPIWDTIVPALAEELPVESHVHEEDTGLHPWEIARMRRFVQVTAARYDDGVETLLVGHSMGGIMACAMAEHFAKTHVLGIVSIFSPHQLFGGMFAQAHGLRPRPVAPLVSFAAQRDELVWWGAEHPHARLHVTLPSNHFTELVGNYDLAKRIATTVRRALFPEA